MTDIKRLATVTAAYTGFLIGSFPDLHKYIEEKLGRPVFTHEMIYPEFKEELTKATKEEFISLWREALEST